MSSDTSGLKATGESPLDARARVKEPRKGSRGAWVALGLLLAGGAVGAGAWATRRDSVVSDSVVSDSVVTAEPGKTAEPSKVEVQASVEAQAGKLEAPSQVVSALRPNAARERLFIDQMTWVEVRDAVQAGAKTVILAAGAIEQNGPHLATGKHNFILHVTLPLIARKLGNTLIAPVVPFSPPDDPEGDYHAGTIDLSEEVFERILLEVAENLKKSGFTTVLLMGESYGNMRGLESASKKLAKRWQGTPMRVVNVTQYYDNARWIKWLDDRGIREVAEGIHDDVRNSSILAVYDPDTLRAQERRQAGRFSINGVQLEPLEQTIALGSALADYQATTVVDAVRRALAAPAPGAKR
jgi:creatinine amidohydrolase